MVEMGLLEAKNAGRYRTYHLSAAVYQQLGKATAYIHRKGVDRIQQEQMVLQFVKSYGEIKREDVLRLFHGLRPRQATYLLERMAKEAKIKAFGEKKGKTYRLP